MRALNLKGRTFQRLTVIGLSHVSAKKRVWDCVCECGKNAKVRTSDLTCGRQQSCGCRRVEAIIATGIKNATHGMTDTSTFKIWSGMIQRCHNPNSPGYHNYGGRGIVVCERWLHSFANFLSDMGERPAGLTIERNDTNGNYEPINCRWATWTEQARNKRNNRRVTINGRTAALSEWCEILGLKYCNVKQRIITGTDPLVALGFPSNTTEIPT